MGYQRGVRGALELTTIDDLHLRLRLVTSAGGSALDLTDKIHAIENLTEHNVFAVQPAGLHSGDEELGAVGVGTSVSHGEETRASVLELEVLISELVAVDGFSTSAVEASEVTTLKHEVLDDAVEDGALEAEGLAGAALTLLTGAEAAEVLGSLGDDVGKELGSEFTI